MTFAEAKAAFIDQLYNERQDGLLTDETLENLLLAGAITRTTYELLLTLQSDGSRDWSKVDKDDEDGSEFEGEDDD